jgi:uncharacterized protein (DUF952 family)
MRANETRAGGRGARSVYHLTTAGRWAAAEPVGEYRPEAFPHEGFVHASNPDQVGRVARRLYADVPDLVLLEIDVSRLGPSSPLVDEVGDPGSDELFPHIYGPVPVAAVVGVRPYPGGST